MRLSLGTLTTVTMVIWSIGCATTPKGDSSDVEILTYEAEMGEQSIDATELNLPWQVNNPGLTQVTVDAVTWTLTVGGHQIDKQTIALDQGVAAGSTATGTIRTRVQLSASDDAFAERENDPVLRWQLTASFEVGGGPDGLTEFEAQWDGEFFAPRRPQVTATAQAAKSDRGSIEVSFTVIIANTNPFPIDIDGLDYEIFVMDELVESGRLASGQRLGAASELRFDVGKTLDQQDKPKLVRALLKADSIPYRIEGQIAAEGLQMAIPVTGEISFAK